MSTQQKTINGATFYVGIIPPRSAMVNTLPRLAALLEPVAGGATRVAMAKDASEGDVAAQVVSSIARALGGADPAKLSALIDDFARVTRVEKDGRFFELTKPAEFDAVFVDGVGDILGWLIFATTVNFGPFLRNLLAKG